MHVGAECADGSIEGMGRSQFDTALDFLLNLLTSESASVVAQASA